MTKINDEVKQLSENELENISGGMTASDFDFLKSKCKYAIIQLQKSIRDYIEKNRPACNEKALKEAIDALELVENDVSKATAEKGFLFCDTYWGRFKACIRGAHTEEFFTDPNYLLIEEMIVME